MAPMNDQDKDRIAKDEYEFRVTVLTTLSRIEANYDAVCRDMEKNHESHTIIFAKIDQLEETDRQQGESIARIEGRASVYGAIMGVVTGVLVSLGIKNCG